MELWFTGVMVGATVMIAPHSAQSAACKKLSINYSHYPDTCLTLVMFHGRGNRPLVTLSAQRMCFVLFFSFFSTSFSEGAGFFLLESFLQSTVFIQGICVLFKRKPTKKT